MKRKPLFLPNNITAQDIMKPKIVESIDDEFKFCRKCGKKILVDADFCNYCGEKVIVMGASDEK